jgi:hypothetical protein
MNRMVKAIVVMAVLGVSAAAPAAWAGDKCNPAVCQYVESVPTSKGSKAATESHSKKVSKLPSSVQRSIRSELTPTEAQTVEKIATSSGLGAPEKIKVKKKERKVIQTKVRTSRVARSKPLPAAFGAVSEGGGGRMLALVIVLSVMTVAALAFAGLRRRTR